MKKLWLILKIGLIISIGFSGCSPQDEDNTERNTTTIINNRTTETTTTNTSNISNTTNSYTTTTITNVNDNNIIETDETNEIDDSIENTIFEVDAGDDKITEINRLVTLRGTITSSTDSIFSYEWKEENATLATTVSFDYMPTTVGEHILTFTVTDDDGATTSDSVTITVEDNNTEIDLTKGLVAHYEFEGNANDSSGNGNDGIEHGGVSYIDGVIGKASKFMGSMNEYIQVSNSESLSIKNQISISVWAKVDTFVFSINPIVTKGYNTEDYTLWLTKNGSSLLLNWNTSQQFWEYDNKTIESDTWVYVTITYDKNHVQYFINGVKTFERNFNLTIHTNSEPLYIGSSYPGADEYFKGQIDDLRIYNRALNQAEITALYKLGQQK